MQQQTGKPTAREQALIDALRAIVTETMDYPPVRPISTDSNLPYMFVMAAQVALQAYGADVKEVVPA